MQRAFRAAFPGTAAALGGLLGFASGGYTGHGPRLQPAGVVHRGEYVFGKKAVQSIGVGNLDAMHSAAQGYSGGGLALSALQREAGREIASPTAQRVQVDVKMHVPEGVTFDQATAIAGNVAIDVMQAGLAQNRRALPRQLDQVSARGR